MIIKLIAAKSKPKEAERYARSLVRYLTEGDRRWLGPDVAGMDYGLTLSAYMTSAPEVTEEPGERVLYRGAFVSGESCDWDIGEKEAARRLERRSRKVKKPVRHAVLSCRPGEQLDEQGCADAVATLATELGCEAGAILWAAHADTDNFHLHMMLVTVDPETGGALPFGQQPDGRAGYKEAMQRAIARIEAAQALQSEEGARYEMRGGEVVRKASAAVAAPERRRAPIRQEILEWEAQSGFASFTRVAQNIAGPILDEAASWPQLHRELAPHGLGIRRAVNGGEIYAGDEHVKLSAVDRKHSWGRLVDRLGAFEEAEGVEPASYKPVVLDVAKAENWLRHGAEEREIGRRVYERVARLMAARDAALGQAEAQLSAYRADTKGFDRDTVLGRDIDSAWPRLRASMIASIRSAFAARIEAVRGLRHAAADMPDLGGIDLDAIGRPDVGIAASWRADRTAPPIVALDGFEAERRGSVVRYWSSQDSDRKERPAMVDDGAIIWVEDQLDRTVEAALTLASKRFGNVAVFGDDAYVDQCRQAAGRLGIAIEVITIEEARRRADRSRLGRAEARRRALEQHGDAGADHRGGASRRRAWARAYTWAAPEEDLPASGVEAVQAGVPHHLDIPAEVPGADAGDPKVRPEKPMSPPLQTVTRSGPRDDGRDR